MCFMCEVLRLCLDEAHVPYLPMPPSKPIVVAGMFQCMARFDNTTFGMDVFIDHAVVPAGVELVSDICVHPRGCLGDSVAIADIVGHVQPECFGSVSFKFIYKQSNLSFLVFNSGSVKLSGGVPRHISSQKQLGTFIDSVFELVCSWLTLSLSQQPYISCLNGTVRSTNAHTPKQLASFVSDVSHRFDRIIAPNLEAKGGRRSAFKCYLLPGRKLHISYDHKGTGQIFAARSFDELHNCVSALGI